jgi:hypothetical protein
VAVPHRCSFDQLSIDVAKGCAISRARFLPDAGTTTCSNSWSYFSCIGAFRSRLGMLGEKELRESAAAGPAFPSGLAPAGPLPCATSTSRCLASLRAHCVGIDVGRQDLSILPGANRITTLHAP